MKFSPYVFVKNPKSAKSANDLPAIGEPRKDTWVSHIVEGTSIYEQEVEGYGYVILYTDKREPKGVLWVDRREYAVLISCESFVESVNGIGVEDIARCLNISKKRETNFKVIDSP